MARGRIKSMELRTLFIYFLASMGLWSIISYIAKLPETKEMIEDITNYGMVEKNSEKIQNLINELKSLGIIPPDARI